jgi:eukaryotic-like serine/threonine-protein kinase
LDEVRAKRIAAELRGRLVGAWTVGGYLGNGASALVVSAEREGQIAALKLIDPEMVERFGAAKQLTRIERERELIGRTEPHLVKIFDGGLCPTTDYLYVVMELLPHPALTKMISAFPRERIGPVIQQIASAARFLESIGLAHRDIKPDNIVITEDYTNSVLLDLGVMLPIDLDTRRDAGSGDAFLGTTRYSPPEYLMRDEEDHDAGWRAITFYQLGAVLHDLIMRRRLFDEINAPPARLIEAVRNARPVVEATDAPPHLVSLARNCLQKDWRLRLDLVRWEHFVENPPPRRSTEAKDRMRRRIAAGPGPVTSAMPGVNQKLKSRRKIVEQLGGAVANTVREICLQSGSFPPIEVDHLPQGAERLITLSTGPSQRYALEATLWIRINLAALDDDGLVVRLSGVAALDAIPQDIARDERIEIYAGDGSAPVLRERLDAFLHVALDAAQNAAGSVTTSVLRLPSLE